MRRLLTLCLSAALLATTAAAPADPLRQAIALPGRSSDLVARDRARHPYEELSFFGVQPGSSVVEIWPGGGYWTQILAPFLHDHGVYYAALGMQGGTEAENFFAGLPLRARMALEPKTYGRVQFTELSSHHDVVASDGSADFVLTFRNLHNWMEDGDAPQVLAALRRALKPGGTLGVEDHRARADRPQDPKASDGYVRQDYAVALIERAGFKFVGSSEIEANPKDTTHWPKGVWTLPPVLAAGKVDRAKYLAIGEADNFVLKFRKIG